MRKNRAGGITLLAFRLYYNATVWRRQWHPTPVLLPGKSNGRRGLVGCSPWGRKESDTTERLHFHFSRIGEGNGNPLQCSCLENPRDGGAWWAAVYGVAQSWTRLKRLSSSSSSSTMLQSPKPDSTDTKTDTRSIKQERKPRNETTHLWSSNPLLRRQE